MHKTFQVLPIAVRIKTKNHNVVDVAPAFLSNLMFCYSSYFLFSSLTGHLSVPWMCCLFLLPGKFCVHTPLPYSSFRFELFKETQIFGHSRLGEVQNIYYMLSCTFSLLICMSVWLFPLPSFLSTMCQRLLPLYGHQHNEKAVFSIHTTSEYG